MRPLTDASPPPGQGVRGVLLPALNRIRHPAERRDYERNGWTSHTTNSVTVGADCETHTGTIVLSWQIILTTLVAYRVSILCYLLLVTHCLSHNISFTSKSVNWNQSRTRSLKKLHDCSEFEPLLTAVLLWSTPDDSPVGATCCSLPLSLWFPARVADGGAKQQVI